MMQTAPLAERITSALADGDSLRYYPAYDLAARAQLPPQAAAAGRARAQLLLVQRSGGRLNIGDAHEYAEPMAFDVDEDAYDHLRARAEALLGAPIPRVQRRWAGVYSELDADGPVAGHALYHRAEVEPGVVLVTGPGGRGMTCSPAIAEEREGAAFPPRFEDRGLVAAILMTRITVACLDMAGTTIADDGTVMEAFSSAIVAQNLPVAAYNQAMTDVRSSMGQSKIEVFRRVLGDEETAQKANDAFENHYAAAVRGGKIAAVPGAEETITALRHAGVRVCLATGFSPATRDAIIDKLVWGGLIDLALSPADAGFWGFEGRGRPWPDLPLIALLKLRGGAVSELAVVGDTTSDIESGRRAGAAIVAGVLTGASTRADLERAGAPLILDTIADILPCVTRLPARGNEHSLAR